MSGLTPEQRAIAARALHDTRKALRAETVRPRRIDPYRLINVAGRGLAARAADLLADGYDRPARDAAVARKWLMLDLSRRVTLTRMARLSEGSS